jgi:hypothetical protein
MHAAVHVLGPQTTILTCAFMRWQCAWGLGVEGDRGSMSRRRAWTVGPIRSRCLSWLLSCVAVQTAGSLHCSTDQQCMHSCATVLRHGLP